MKTGEIYIQSPFLNFDQSAPKVVVSNLISGRSFEMGETVVSMLRFFKKPRSLDEFSQEFSAYSGHYQKIIDFLYQRGLIYDAESPEAFTIGTVAVKNRLFGAGMLNPEKEENRIVVTGIPFGKGHGRSANAADFPDYLREYAQRIGLQALSNSGMPYLGPGLDYDNLKTVLKSLKDAGNIFINTNESTPFIYEKIYQVARNLFEKGNRPVFIGGDHSVSFPLIRAAAEKYPDLHILHFDAHTDTYTSPYDQIDHVHKVHHYGNFMLHVLKLENVRKVWQFGIRGLHNALETGRPKRTIYWAEELKSILAKGESIPDLPENVPFYVTFDIDVFDPPIAPGTASPVVGGLDYSEIRTLLTSLLKNRNIIGADLVEVHKQYDTGDVTVQLAITVLLNLLSHFKVDNP